jgi:hypothetical protein
MLLPPQLSVESHTEKFWCIGIRDLCAIDVDWSLCNPFICKADGKIRRIEKFFHLIGFQTHDNNNNNTNYYYYYYFYYNMKYEY